MSLNKLLRRVLGCEGSTALGPGSGSEAACAAALWVADRKPGKGTVPVLEHSLTAHALPSRAPSRREGSPCLTKCDFCVSLKVTNLIL